MQTRQAPATGRKRMPRAEREQQILAVAEQVFAAEGYQGTSMDDIAAQVGLSKPMLYEYFGSKEGLLLACVRRRKSELLEATIAAASTAESPEQMLHGCLLAFFKFGDEHAQAWALLRNETAASPGTVGSELEAIRMQQTEFTAGLLNAALPGLDPIELEAYAEAIIGACERLALWRDRRPEITPEMATEHLMRLFAPSLTQHL